MAPGSSPLIFIIVCICVMAHISMSVTINVKSNIINDVYIKSQKANNKFPDMRSHKYEKIDIKQEVPKYMWNLYNSQVQRPSSCASQSSIIYKNKDDNKVYSTCGTKKTLNYAMSQSEAQTSTSVLKSASLHINIQPRLHKNQKHRNIRQMLMVTVSLKDSTLKKISTVVYARDDIEIDVTSIVSSGIISNTDEIQMVLSVRLLNGKKFKHQGKSCFDFIHTSSFSVTWVDESECSGDVENHLSSEEIKESSMIKKEIPETRVRRSASGVHLKRNMRKFKKGSRPCSLRSMYIDFKDIGWDSWVIAPKGYEAGSCRGKCKFPMQKILNPTNHAVVHGIKYSVDGRGGCPNCVATELKPITMLYYDYSGNIVLKQYKDMVATDCGCR